MKSLLTLAIGGVCALEYDVVLTGEAYPIKESYENDRSFFIVLNQTLDQASPAFVVYNGMSDGCHEDSYGQAYEDLVYSSNRLTGLSSRDLNLNAATHMAINLLKEEWYVYDLENLSTAAGTDYPPAPTPLGYSWDYGDIHYVQLHAYPTYDEKTDELSVGTSLEWLRDDLEAAAGRGKESLLIFTDGYGPSSEFVKRAKRCARNTFRFLLDKFNVKGIFTVCKHGEEDYCRAEKDEYYGNVPVYCTGRAGENEYTQLHVNGSEVSVSRYSFLTAEPKLLRKVGVLGEETLVKSCSS